MRPQVERMSNVGTAVDVTADLFPAEHDESAQGPIAAADGECAGAVLLEVRQPADHPLEIELSLPHARSWALPWPSATAIPCLRSPASTTRGARAVLGY